MEIMTTDFESYWDSECSLSKLSPLQYIRHQDFEVISASIKIDAYPTDVFFGEDDVRHALKCLDTKKRAALAHNMSGFDAYVLSYVFGVKPKLWLDTLAMARPIHAKTVGLGLGKLVEHYARELIAMGIKPKKDNTILLNTKGKHLADFTASERELMGVYNMDDSDQCWGLFQILKKHFTGAELWQIDALVRMRTEPAFDLDTVLLENAASVERSRKFGALLDLARKLGLSSVPEGVDDPDLKFQWDDEDSVVASVKTELASAAKFSKLLVSLGVEVPMKPSPTNPKNQVPALAKTDQAFIDLQEHDDPVVSAAARARLDVKSTLLETRIEKFQTAASLCGGLLPIPMRYCGADTTGRDSGEEYNPQNMPRINPDFPRPSDALRNSLRAPEDCLVIVADQSGIELRVNHFLWKVPSSMALYQASPDKADLYRAFASDLFGKHVNDIAKTERQVGKVAQLGLGFGSGAATFQRIAKTMGGISMPLSLEIPAEWLDDETGGLMPEHDDDWRKLSDSTMTAERVVRQWRYAYKEIVEGWRACQTALFDIQRGVGREVDPWGLVSTCTEGFVLPSGRLIRYPDLRQIEDGEWPDGRPKTSWVYAHGRHMARLTGPKADENIVQALARDSIFDCALEFFKRTGLRPKLRVHDELVYVVPKGEAHTLLTELQSILRTPPKWWPELVTWSEGDAAPSYGAAK